MFLLFKDIPLPDADASLPDDPLFEATTTSYGSSSGAGSGSSTSNVNNARPGSMVRVPEVNDGASTSGQSSSLHSAAAAVQSVRHGHSRNSSWDMRTPFNTPAKPGSSGASGWTPNGHSRTASIDMRQHSRNSSADLNKFVRNDLGLVFSPNQVSGWTDPLRVQIIKAHHNWIAVAYPHFVTCYGLKDSSGWQLVFTSPYIESQIERLAINAKLIISSSGEQTLTKMVAISYGNLIRLWRVSDDGSRLDIGVFSLNVRVEYLFFIGSQLVALSSSGKIGVWHAMTQHWQIQDLEPILSFDTAGSFLLLGCNNGSIYYIGK